MNPSRELRSLERDRWQTNTGCEGSEDHHDPSRDGPALFVLSRRLHGVHRLRNGVPEDLANLVGRQRLLAPSRHRDHSTCRGIDGERRALGRAGIFLLEAGVQRVLEKLDETSTRVLRGFCGSHRDTSSTTHESLERALNNDGGQLGHEFRDQESQQQANEAGASAYEAEEEGPVTSLKRLPSTVGGCSADRHDQWRMDAMQLGDDSARSCHPTTHECPT